MTRLLPPFSDLPVPGNRLCDRETSAPGVPPGQENCTRKAQAVRTATPAGKLNISTVCVLFHVRAF